MFKINMQHIHSPLNIKFYMYCMSKLVKKLKFKRVIVINFEKFYGDICLHNKLLITLLF